MFFIRISKPEKIEFYKAEVEKRRRSTEISDHLAKVRRVIIEGPQDAKFAPLWEALKESSSFKRDYAEAVFKYTDGLNRPQVITGKEAGEELFRDITSKHTQLLVLSRLMKKLLEDIQKTYVSTRRLESGGAARVNLGLLGPQFQLYIEALIHSIKATLELYATFVQFILPPPSRAQRQLPSAMDDQIKFFKTDEGIAIEPKYAKYLGEKMEWFFPLKNLRDAVAHFGSAILHAEEDSRGIELSLYPRRTHLLENRVPYTTIESWIWQYLDFCEFYHAHFIERIKKDSGA